MKRTLLVAVTVCAMFLLSACGASKRALQTPVETFLLPGTELKSGDGLIRGWGSGTSDSQSAARKKAQMQASAELAASLKSIVEQTIEGYTTDLEENVASESKSLLDAKTKITVKQALTGAVIVYDRWNKNEATGEMTNYMVMELKGEEFLQTLYKELGESSDKIDKNLLRERFMKLIDESGK